MLKNESKSRNKIAARFLSSWHMLTKTKGKKKEVIHPELPKKVSLKHFNRYILPHLSKGKRGPKPKISYFKIFNYILKVLRTGMQWDQLKTYKNELHWSKVYARHNRWSKDGSYQKLFEASVINLVETDQLNLSTLHGDGSNTVVKKGGQESPTQAISTRREKKRLP